jgi:hypothetical protein
MGRFEAEEANRDEIAKGLSIVFGLRTAVAEALQGPGKSSNETLNREHHRDYVRYNLLAGGHARGGCGVARSSS